MTPPIIINHINNLGVLIETVPHLPDEDTTQITIPQGLVTGYNKIERLNGNVKVDAIHFWTNESGDTVIRWHLPKSLFQDNVQYILKITSAIPPIIIPYNDITPNI